MKQFLFLFSCIAISFGIATAIQSNDAALALLSVKASLIDPLNKLENWKGALHCNWTGIWCNVNGSVVKLDLSQKNLSGVVSRDIQQLPNLAELNLSGNELSSSLPISISNLTLLKSFDVSQNNFVGDFPSGLGRSGWLTYINASSNNFSGFLPEEIGNLTSLESLDVRGNFFEGPIPKRYKNLQKLKYLGLAGNNLTGPIPREISQLSSLETMILGYNGFEGGIPDEIGNLTNLAYLDLAVGNLEGRIPVELGKLEKLSTVFLYQNNFEGKIPAEIGKLTSMVMLDLSDNQLSGEIPEELTELKNLQLLNLMRNKLTGRIPSGLGDLAQLEIFELWNNSLSGPLPANLGQNSPLQWLDVSSNSLSGEIPAGLCNGGNLIKLILFNNAFSGPIPLNLSICPSLVRVRMQNNLISGTIPPGFGKLTKLQRLELANNNLTGEIPDVISLSTSLSFIDLSHNHLRSTLPSSIFSIPNLQNFLVSNNNIIGGVPDQFQDCPSLAVLDLSSNAISGNIPESIASCQKLVTLNLRNNNFSGEISRAISMMPSLAILDLSNNSLTGALPASFGSSPALEMLNVSYNKLEGPVPSNGMLNTINPNDLIGNAGLCGGVLPSCSQNSVAILSREKTPHIKHIIAGWVVGISTLLGIMTLAFGGIWVYKRWYSNGGCFSDQFSGEWPWRLMAFQRLNFTTDDILACIKETNIIGMGGSGIVYKAEVQRPHSIVAVKKIWTSGADIEKGNSDDIVAEVNLLGRLRHRNIVKLYGYLYRDSEVMMVYEYMPNGSLWDALHGKPEARVLVDWVSRYNIAVGVAQGLAYLHHDCHPPVLHRDIKSNNILLDTNLEARIADFGVARMIVKKNETMSMVAGSYGYIAPEYGYTLKVDEKSDVYSYGVVLMELLTGKRPLEPEFGDSINIVEWFRVKIRNEKSLEEALDPNIGSKCKLVQEEMLLVLQIALLCTAKFPKDRPSTRDVITMLGEAKPRRKSNSNTTNNANIEKPVFSTSPVSGLL